MGLEFQYARVLAPSSPVSSYLVSSRFVCAHRALCNGGGCWTARACVWVQLRWCAAVLRPPRREEAAAMWRGVGRAIGKEQRHCCWSQVLYVQAQPWYSLRPSQSQHGNAMGLAASMCVCVFVCMCVSLCVCVCVCV